MNKSAVVVSSCDAYRDCWGPFIFSIKNHWGDLDMPVYIISNHEEIIDEIVKFIKVGDDKGWASNMKAALQHINADYILYLQEDYWLVEKVDNTKIQEQFAYCQKEGIGMLRLSYPYYDQYQIDSLHAISPIAKEKYALCLQAAIWKKSTLQDLLVDGWTGWDFETKLHSRYAERVRMIRAQVMLDTVDDGYKIKYVDGTGIRKGRWTQDAVRFLKENGFEDLIKKREVEGKWLRWLIDLRDSFILKYPATAIIRLMNKYHLNF